MNEDYNEFINKLKKEIDKVISKINGLEKRVDDLEWAFDGIVALEEKVDILSKDFEKRLKDLEDKEEK